MNSKKAITLLVLVTLLVAMVPAVPMASATLTKPTTQVNNDDDAVVPDWAAGTIDDGAGEKGHLIIVTGDEDSVSSGYEVNIYWDTIAAWNGEKGLLNTTAADDDGGYEIWFEVPESTFGTHQIWITASDQSDTVRVEFAVIPDCDISTSSGLAGTKIYTDLWGYDDNEDAIIVFAENADPTTWGAKVVATELLYEWVLADLTSGTGGAARTVVNDLQLAYYPITAGNIVVNYNDGGGVADLVIAHWDGTALVQDDAMFVSGTWDQNTGLLDLVLLQADADLMVVGDDIKMMAYTAADADGDRADEDQDEATNIVDTDYEGQTDFGNIIPGTFTLEQGNGGAAICIEGGVDGSLVDGPAAGTVTGSVNYVTGEWDIEYAAAPAAFDIYADYETIETIANYVDVLATMETDDLGSVEDRRVTIPEGTVEGDYWVVGLDGDGNDATDDFKIGAVITLSTESAMVGETIGIEGEGFNPGGTIVVTLEKGGDVWTCYIVDDEDEVKPDGEFDIEIVVPMGDDADDDYEIKVTVGGDFPVADFEITDLARVSVDPDFGAQGSKIMVSGENYPKGADVQIELWNDAEDTRMELMDDTEVDSDGTFEVEVRVPTENDGAYTVLAYAGDYDVNGLGEYEIQDFVDFRIGTVLVLLSEDSGNVGEKIVLTGNGFTDNGEWNATFGDVAIFEEEDIGGTGLLESATGTPEFFVPQLAPGVYPIIVWDMTAELTVELEFTVVEYTTLELGTYEAPNEFNTTVNGWYWPEIDDDINTVDNIEFVLWNSTDEWDMDVKQMLHDGVGGIEDPAVINGTGFLVDGWWEVPDSDTLSKGTYWINATLTATNDQSYFMQVEFVVGDVHEAIAPRKASFRVGDTVSFNVEHSFGGQAAKDFDASTITVYDPEGSVYWEIADYDDGDWYSSDKYWSLKASAQTDGGNPCVLLDDAPLGEWSFVWEDEDGDEVLDGTFMVEASAENLVNEAVADLANQIDDLTADLSGVTDDFDDVKSDISGVLAVAEQAVAAANAATEAVNAVATQANNAGAAAEAAQVAAENAADAASGLTTLVYGAIGAALVAALAAIVSLMQISRRIAG